MDFEKNEENISPEVKLKEVELKKHGMYEKLKNFQVGDNIIFELVDGRIETYNNLDNAIKFFAGEGPKVDKGVSEIKDFYLSSEKKD